MINTQFDSVESRNKFVDKIVTDAKHPQMSDSHVQLMPRCTSTRCLPVDSLILPGRGGRQGIGPQAVSDPFLNARSSLPEKLKEKKFDKNRIIRSISILNLKNYTSFLYF